MSSHRFAAPPVRAGQIRAVTFLALLAAGAFSFAGLRAELVREANATLALPPALPSGTYSTVDAFPGMLFLDPLALVTPPGESNRLFIVEQTGRISVIPDLSSPVRETFMDITPRVRSTGNEEGLLGLAFHPNYHVAGQPGHGHFYVYYQATISDQRRWRLSRFSVMAGNPNRGDPDSEVPLISQRDFSGNHNGGDLHFGDDGYLYVSVGDEGGADDGHNNGQRIDKNFFAAVLRLDVDLREGNLQPNPHAAIHAGTYRVPADNPFVGATHFNGLAVNPGSVRTEIWAIGLRNPWRMSFDRPTGRLFVADVGQNAREEINILSPQVFAGNGGVPNYGWSFREGSIAFTNGPGGATPPPGFSAIHPIHDYPHTLGRSVTGGLVYRGARYPELAGSYLFSDYVSGRIWAMADPGGPSQSVTQIASRAQIAAFGLDPSTGDILLARDNSNRGADDPIYRLVRTPAGGQAPPALLSQTGAFQNLATLAPQPGIVPYEINAPFWSDHALKRRWFSIPDPAARMAWSRDGEWAFPAGQVWIKHFELDLDRDAPGTQRVRLETRFLVKTAGDVYGITYRWNAEQTDAVLVGEEGESATYTVIEDGAPRLQTWRFPSRTDCRTCHNPTAGWALGFNTRQLNLPVDHGSGPAAQIAALAGAGYFENEVEAPGELPAFAPPFDPAFPLEDRARSYLASNCVACHQPGGVGMGAWSARPELTLAESGLLDSPLVNNAGNPHMRTLVPGDPAHSMILERLKAPRSGAGPLAPMPPLASNEIDEEGAALLSEWLLSLRKVLFVRGADRSGGFLSASNDAQRTEHLSDIGDFTAGSPNHGWGQLAEALRGEGFLVEQIAESAENQSGPSQGIAVPFENLNLAQYRAIVFGSNNAVYGQSSIDAIDAWIRGGGGALFISDANFGGDWADAADSDQQFLDRFGLVMNQDLGTYVRSRASGDFALPNHPVLAGVAAFDGEGVSPVSIGAPPPDVHAAVVSPALGPVRRNAAPFGGNRQGPSTDATAEDGALLLAEAGEGRIAGHFDRNTFFNEGGTGSDLTRHDNLRYALNLFTWLAEGSLPPPAPSNLTASEGAHLDRVALSWSGVEGAEFHTVYRGSSVLFAEAALLATVPAAEGNAYDDHSPEPGAVWRYWVTATFDGTESGPAGPASGWRAERPTAAVTLSALSHTYDGTPKPAGATTDPPGLTVILTYDGSPTAPTNAGSYAVVATVEDEIYQGGAGGTLVIGKAAQAIDFPAIPGQLANATVSLSAAGGASGNPVTFAVTAGPGVITGGDSLSFTGAGEVTVTASQAGDGNHEAAAPVARTFTVDKVPAIVNLTGLAQTYDGSPRPAGATTEPAGLGVAFTYDGSPTVPTNAGSYALVATIDDPIYQGSASGTLVIGKAAQAIDFPAIPGQLANATVNLSATGGGSTSPVTFAVTAGPGVIAGGDSLTFTGAGEVTVTANQAGDDNHLDAAEVSRSFAVSKAPAAVSLGGLARTYDGAPKPVEASAEPGGLAVAVTYDGSPAAPTDAGSYAVVAAVEDAIYEGGASGTLVIGKAAQAIDFPAIPDQLVDATVNLSATGGASGNPVTFAVTSGPAVLGEGDRLTFTGTGEVVVTASQAGDGNHEPAADVSRSFQVAGVPAQVLLSGLEQVYDGTPRVVGVSTVPEGLNVNLLYDGSAVPPTGAGSYAVLATMEDAIYEGGASATMVVAKAGQSISFDPVPDQPPGATVSLAATGGGSGNPVVFAVTGGPAVLNGGNLLSFTGSGTVMVTASQEGDGNHEPAAAVARSFAVDPRVGSDVETPGEAAKDPEFVQAPWEDRAAGTFEGLLRDPDGGGLLGVVQRFAVRAPRRADEEGGSFSAQLSLRGERQRLRGAFDAEGRHLQSIALRNGGPLEMDLQLMETGGGAQLVHVQILWHGFPGEADPVAAGGELLHAPYHRRNNPAPAALTGDYTLILPSEPGWGVGEPGGDGWASLAVGPDGGLRLRGVLGEGTRLTAAALLSGDGRAPLYAEPHRTRPEPGRFGGMLAFRNMPGVSDCDGLMQWIKFANERDRVYPEGFALEVWALGSRYAAPGRDERALAELGGHEGNAELMLIGPSVPGGEGSLLRVMTWTERNRLEYSGPEQLSARVQARRGELRGDYRDPVSGARVRFQGVVFQKQGLAAGHFVEGGLSGAARIAPAAGVE